MTRLTAPLLSQMPAQEVARSAVDGAGIRHGGLLRRTRGEIVFAVDHGQLLQSSPISFACRYMSAA